MKIKVKMEMENEEYGTRSIVEDVIDDEDDIYEPEVIAEMVCRVMRSFGYPEDIAEDIKAIGWERLCKEKPYEPMECLVSYKNDQFLKSDADRWDGKKFIKHGDKVVFWAMFPPSPAFWSNDNK